MDPIAVGYGSQYARGTPNLSRNERESAGRPGHTSV